MLSLLSGSVIDDPLRKLLPASIVAALDVNVEQMQLLIIEPLLVSEPAELSRRFTELSGRFYELYLSGALLVMATLGQNASVYQSLPPRAFQWCEDLIRANMGSSLGRDAALTALRGLATVQRVVNGVLRTIADPPSRARADEASMFGVANWIVAYFQSMAGVLWALNGRVSIPVRPENVVQLAYWSANYASGCYAFARSSGLIRSAPPGGPIPVSDPEDVELANQGLGEYAGLLVSEDLE